MVVSVKTLISHINLKNKRKIQKKLICYGLFLFVSFLFLDGINSINSSAEETINKDFYSELVDKEKVNSNAGNQELKDQGIENKEETILIKGETTAWPAVQDKEYENALSKETVLIVDLNTALEMALDKNLDIEVQEYNVKIAKDKLLGSTAQFLPSVSLIQTASRRDGNIQLFGSQTIPVNQKSVQPRALSTFGLFRGGRVLFGWISSKKTLESTRQDLDLVKQTTLKDTSISYLNVQRYKAELESEMTRLEQAELNLKEREIALKVGTDIRLSVLLAQQEVDSSKARIAMLKGNLYSESGKLNKFLNLPIETLIIPAASVDESEIITWTQTPRLTNLVMQALNNNPDIKSRKSLIDSYKAKQAQSFAPFLPSIQIQNISSFVGANYEKLSPDQQFILTAQYDALESLGGTGLSNFLQAKHLKEKTKIELDKRIKELESQISESYTNVLSGKENFQASKSAFATSEEAYRNALARLKAEVGTVYEIKVAQSELEKARANYFDSLINYKVAQINLINNIGAIDISTLTGGLQL